MANHKLEISVRMDDWPSIVEEILFAEKEIVPVNTISSTWKANLTMRSDLSESLWPLYVTMFD